MLIAIVGTKGAQGKSTLANAIAHEFGFGIITNDIDSSCDEYFPQGRVLKVRNDALIPIIPDHIGAVFDGKAGIDEPVVRDAVTNADCVVIPCVYGVEEVKRAKRAIREMEKLNDKIVIVANSVGKEESDELRRIFEHEFPYSVYVIRRSRLVAELLFTAESLSKKKNRSPLVAHWMKDVIEQFEEFYQGIGLRKQ